jgi:hypothetical protein
VFPFSHKLQLFLERPQVYVGPKRIEVGTNATVFIHCRVVAEPLVTQVGIEPSFNLKQTNTSQVSWLQNDQPMMLNDRIILHYNNTLEMRHVTSADRAIYKCQAINKAGLASDEATVLVVGRT